MLTTEKDAVRFEACHIGNLPLAAVPLGVTIEPEAVFCDWLSRPHSFPRARLESPKAHPRAGPGLWPTQMRHRLEYMAVRAPRRLPPGAAGAGWSSVRARFWDWPPCLFDRAHRRIARRNVAASVPRAIGRRAARHRSRGVRPFRATAVRIAEVQHADARPPCWRAWSSRGRARPAGLTRREGRAVRHGALRVLGAAGDGSCAAASAHGRVGPRARQPRTERPARADPHAHRQHRHLSPGHHTARRCGCCTRAKASAS